MASEQPSVRRLVAIESPYNGDIPKNERFARNVCHYALRQGLNPHAMHLFFPQFLDEHSVEERNLGIECGLQWTDLADEVWFCLREGESLTRGMMLAVDRLHEMHPEKPFRFRYFTQDGDLVRESDLETMRPR